MSDLTVFASTYNLNTRGSSLTSTHLQHWLRPAFSGENGISSPDLVVIGVQELIPLYESCRFSLALSCPWSDCFFVNSIWIRSILYSQLSERHRSGTQYASRFPIPLAFYVFCQRCTTLRLSCNIHRLDHLTGLPQYADDSGAETWSTIHLASWLGCRLNLWSRRVE